jgi:hypothetical protein
MGHHPVSTCAGTLGLTLAGIFQLLALLDTMYPCAYEAFGRESGAHAQP